MMNATFCTKCGKALGGRFCTGCGHDSLKPNPNTSQSPLSTADIQAGPQSKGFRHLEIISLDVSPDLAANKDSLTLHAAVELEMFVEVGFGGAKPWTSSHRTETVALMMARGKIPGDWTPLAFEFPRGPAELFIHPTPKSVQVLKTLALRGEPVWKRRWTAEQNSAFAAAIVNEMGVRLPLSSNKQAIKIALSMSSNRLTAHEV
jgi:hypothetical protein